MIETLDDVIEYWANKAGVYGAHNELHPDGQCECRVCFAMEIRGRIEAALDVERRLGVLNPDHYIAWMRYIEHPERATRIVTCDSDATGAFRVYRLPQSTKGGAKL